MTMQFRNLAASLTTLLGTASGSNYRVIGYQTRSVTGEEVVDNSRLVQVFYGGGDLPMSGGALSGQAKHNTEFGVQIVVSKAAEGDLATIDDPLSTALQLQTAIAGVASAEYLAEESFNEVVDLVWNTLIDPRNQGLGLDQNLVSSRWAPRIQKDKPLRQGTLVVIKGFIALEASVEEVATGDTPTPLDTIDMGVELNDSDDELAGTTNTGFQSP